MEARYKLRADAFFVKTSDGVWIRNNKGSFSISGRSAYPLVKTLFARLEGGATLDEICGGLGAEQRRTVEAIIRRLEQHGFAKRVAALAEEVPAWASELYDDQLRFIDHHLDASFARFSAFRAKRAVCVGEAALLGATLTALAEYGAARVVAVARATAETASLEALAAAAQRRDPGTSFRVQIEDAADEPRAYTLLLLDAEELTSVQRAAPRAGDEVVAAVVHVDDRLVVTPPLDRAASICLDCVLRSVAPRARRSNAPVRPVAASLAANQLVYGMFCHLVGISADAEPLVRIVDGDTLSVKVHRMLPHPLCHRHGGTASVVPLQAFGQGLVRPDIPGGLDGEALIAAQDALATLVGRWSDDVTGPLLRVGEGELPQLPLAASACVVHDPGAPALETPRTIICRGLSAREARNQAVLLSLEWLASRLLELRRGAIDLPFEPVALGVGWSAGEAAYRALHHATLASAATPLEPAGTDELRATRIGTHLLELVGERAPSVAFAAATAPIGMFVATATAPGGAQGRGAGVSERAAKLQALLHLAIALTAPEEPARAAMLSCEVTSWSAAITGAEEHRAGRGAQRFHALDGLFPFSAGDVHVVLLGPAVDGA